MKPQKSHAAVELDRDAPPNAVEQQHKPRVVWYYYSSTSLVWHGTIVGSTWQYYCWNFEIQSNKKTFFNLTGP